MKPSLPRGALWDAQLAEALETAEHSVGAYYAIRPREWATRFRYDIASSAEHPELAFSPSALAQIVRLENTSQSTSRYRIVLREAEVCALGELFGLQIVLTAALAHELVHLVRFGQGLASFDASDAERLEEERRVTRVSEEALLRSTPPDQCANYRRIFASMDPGR